MTSVTEPLLMYMKGRHHAGAKLAVVVIDERKKLHGFQVAPRVAEQQKVLRVAREISCPIWFVEIGGGPHDTLRDLVRAAGFYNTEAAFHAGRVLPASGPNVFASSALGEWLEALSPSFVVVCGQKADAIRQTIVGIKSDRCLMGLPNCFVLTSDLLVDAPLQTIVRGHPRVSVFETIGGESLSLEMMRYLAND